MLASLCIGCCESSNTNPHHEVARSPVILPSTEPRILLHHIRCLWDTRIWKSRHMLIYFVARGFDQHVNLHRKKLDKHFKYSGILCRFGFAFSRLAALAACRPSPLISVIFSLPLVLSTWLLRVLGTRCFDLLEELLAAPGGRVLHVQEYLGLKRLKKVMRCNIGWFSTPSLNQDTAGHSILQRKCAHTTECYNSLAGTRRK